MITRTVRSELRFFPRLPFVHASSIPTLAKNARVGAPSVLVVLAKSGAMIHTHGIL
jgi:hypothetical protein